LTASTANTTPGGTVYDCSAPVYENVARGAIAHAPPGSASAITAAKVDASRNLIRAPFNWT
jgi:hypothetical protein